MGLSEWVETAVDSTTSRMEGVTCSIAKVFLGSAKTRRAILTKRLTSFWA